MIKLVKDKGYGNSHIEITDNSLFPEGELRNVGNVHINTYYTYHNGWPGHYPTGIRLFVQDENWKNISRRISFDGNGEINEVLLKKKIDELEGMYKEIVERKARKKISSDARSDKYKALKDELGITGFLPFKYTYDTNDTFTFEVRDLNADEVRVLTKAWQQIMLNRSGDK